jgi:hypothetical protein
MPWSGEAVITDQVYAIAFLFLLGASLLVLSLLWFFSSTPFFARRVKPIRFRHPETEPLLSNGYSENGDVALMEEQTPELFKGWRFGMGVLLNCTLLALVVLHTALLVVNKTGLLGIAFVVYWVCTTLRVS